MYEELVPLSLCDIGTPNPEKEAIVRAMLEAGRPQQFPVQKPIMKTHIPVNHRRDVVGLHEFAGEWPWLKLERLSMILIGCNFAHPTDLTVKAL